MRALLLAAATAVAVLAVPASVGAKPTPKPDQPPSFEYVVSPATVTIVDEPISVSGGVSTQGCAYACFVQCFDAFKSGGQNDWTGRASLWLSSRFCGDGYNLTYTSGGGGFDQGGFYSIYRTDGPAWTGGCWGCQSRTLSSAIWWKWDPPPYLAAMGSHYGYDPLSLTVYAWGGSS